jgi:long-chain acyl-CoA synthetase
VKVFITLKPGQKASPEEIIEFCRENLAPFKVPKFVEFRSELPKTIVGKVLRRELLAQELERRKAGRAESSPEDKIAA